MLRLGQRHCLKYSTSSEMNDTWAVSSANHVKIDTVISANGADYNKASNMLRRAHQTKACSHVQTLTLQGALITAITETVTKSAISVWSSQCMTLATPLFKFVRKAIVQQLPTLVSLTRWGKSTNPLCVLCSKKQTNKHALFNCASPVVLERYRLCHDPVLSILAAWIATVLKPGRVLHVDLNSADYKPITDVFHSLRSDIVIVNQNIIVTLELAVCHE